MMQNNNLYILLYRIALNSRLNSLMEVLDEKFEYMPLMPNSGVIRSPLNPTQILNELKGCLKPGRDDLFIAKMDVDECDGYIPTTKIDWMLKDVIGEND